MREPKTAEIPRGILQESAQLYPGLLISAYNGLGTKVSALHFPVTDLSASVFPHPASLPNY